MRCQNDFTAALRRKYQLQVKLSWPKEQSFITDYLWGRKTERSPIWSLIEIGAAHGDLSPHLETLFLSHLAQGRHYLVERNPDCWQTLNERWSTRVDLRVFQGDWMDFRHLLDGVDFILCRFVLHEEKNEPRAFLEKCFDALSPGGVLAVIDIDDACWGAGLPEADELNRIQHELSYLATLLGQDRQIGRKLPRYFAQAGFDEIEFGAVTLHSDIENKKEMLEMAQPAMSWTMLRQLSENEQTAMAVPALHQLDLWCAQTDLSFMIQAFVCVGAKPQ